MRRTLDLILSHSPFRERRLDLRGGGGQWRFNHPITGECFELLLIESERKWTFRPF